MSKALWTDAEQSLLEESADKLEKDVVYEQRCFTLDDRFRFLGLLSSLRSKARHFKDAMEALRTEKAELELEREALRAEKAAFEARQRTPEPELITFNGMRREFGFQSAALRKITARKDFPPGRAFGEHQQAKRYWNRQAVKEWFSSNPDMVQEALCG